MKTRDIVTVILFLSFLTLSVAELAGKPTAAAKSDTASVLYVRSVEKEEVKPEKKRKRIDYSGILNANEMSKDG